MLPAMHRGSWRIVGLTCIAAALGAASLIPGWPETVAESLLFGAWFAALLLLLVLALRLPLQTRLPRRWAVVRRVAIVAAAVGVTGLANLAVYRHDAHFDLTEEERFTPPTQAEAVVSGLDQDVAVTYFYNTQDPTARRTKSLLDILSRRSPRFHVRTLDLDEEPALARRYGVRFYNTVVLEADGQRLRLDNTTDLTQIAFATLRILKEREQTVCFVTGHGEFTIASSGGHVHFSHQEMVGGNADVLEGRADGLERLHLALRQVGYAVREITLLDGAGIPDDCAMVADIGPRSAYARDEIRILADYMAAGGRALLMFDPFFALTPELGAMLAKLGVAMEAGLVVDPLDHYTTDAEKVAVPSYRPHPITSLVALTFFPGIRPIRVSTPPDGIAMVPLFSSSKDSYVRPVAAAGGLAPAPAKASPAAVGAGAQGAGDGANAGHRTGPRILALSAEGLWPGAAAAAKPFRLVLIGDSDFVTNAFFPDVANGTLAISMINWLAGNEGMPATRPESYAVPRITLTHRQMQAIFAIVEILLPLSVVSVGLLVWWRRR